MSYLILNEVSSKEKISTDAQNPQRRDLILNYLRFINYQLNFKDIL